MESTVFKSLFVDERQKSMLDLLNLLYVSMTRSGERLYILTKFPSVKQEEISSLPGFFKLYLQQVNLWIEGLAQYSFGAKTVHLPKIAKAETRTIIQEDMISTDWRKKIELRMKAPLNWDMDEPAQNSQWGSTLHEVLSGIVTGNDIAFAIEKASLAGLIMNSDLGKVEKILLSVVSNPLLSRLFSDEVKVRTEVEILLPEGSFYRPDRVVFDKEFVTILDYKTGKPNSKHGDQLLKYAGYIGDMGYRNIKCLLVYLGDDLSVVEV
jgi:ATP-dependent exoDNAse (exonuclease V) beta subunit